MKKKGGILDQRLCIKLARWMRYVSWQAPSSGLKTSIKDVEMVQVWLSAEAIRQIGLLVAEVQRIKRDSITLTARANQT